MASPRSGSVPGKLMIAGEYAVLDGGHRALSVAVGELVRWQLGAASDDPAIAVDAFDTTFRWRRSEAPAAGIATLVHDALAGGEGAGWRLDRDLSLRIDGQVGGVKVGLGTSAATVVGVLRACAACAVDLPLDVSSVAHDVHFAAQGGKGSGYDIGTIGAGGCVAYDAATRRTDALAWPDGLWALALFTGEAANTRKAIRRKPTAQQLNRIGDASEALIAAWSSGELDAIIGRLEQCQRAFDEAVACGAMLPSERVDATCAWIRDNGAVARVSGAGGGDCVLAFGGDPSRRDAILAAWREQDGVCVHRLPQDIAHHRGARGAAGAPRDR